jgi:hypothetical protein
MGEYLVSNITYPATQYEPTETPPTGTAVYHEDREVTLSATTGSQMFRTYNAQFNPDTAEWGFPEGSSAPAYATAQNPDGSIHYFTNPLGATTWTTWAGSGNNAVYNAVDYGLNVDDTSGGADNTTALQSAVTAAATGGGGRVFIPAGVYNISGTIEVPPTNPVTMNPVGIVIEGCGGSTELVQPLLAEDTLPIFSMTGSNNRRGVRLKNLSFNYSNPKVGVFAVVSSGSEEVVCEGCLFVNCPAMSMNGAHNGLLNCSVTYEVEAIDGATNDAVMIYMSDTNDFVDLCYIYQTPPDPSKNGPTGCIAIQIQGAEEPRVTNTNIADFDYGIQILGHGDNPINPTHGFFSNVAGECNTYGVFIQPSAAEDTITEVFFTNCEFERTVYATDYTTPVPTGAYIGVYPGAASDTVSDIFFTNCMFHDWAGPGIQIDGGQDIVVTGGRYGQNATDSTMTTSGAIAVTGPAVRVIIDGADCFATIPAYTAQPPATNTQPYSISVTGAVTGMQVVACNLTGNGVGPLYAPTNGTDLRVIDCRGYNDQIKQLTTTVPATVTRFNGATYGYFGPSTFYIIGTGTAVSAIKVSNNGNPTEPAVTTGLVTGAFRLDPGEWGEIDHLGGGITFVLVGT